jgi:hypothetical protein
MILFFLILDLTLLIFSISSQTLVFIMGHNDLPNEDPSSGDSSKNPDEKKKQKAPPKLSDITRLVLKICKELKEKPGVHSVIHMAASGFKYTGDRDTAVCKECGLKASDWKIDKKPFAVHSEQNPNCPFVRGVKFSAQPRKSTTTGSQSTSIASFESDILQQVRRRTFSHWPHRISPSSAEMIEAGFFTCNVGDRVICIYCNLICQQWTPHTDDPCEVHKTLSPSCPYVTKKLIHSSTSSMLIVNENPARTTSANLEQLRSNEIVFTAAYHPTYAELPKRHASFATWPNENLPSVDDLVRAGFFYTGTKNIVTCFYCNGSLQNWGPNDNPMIEHTRSFPNCAYAKQLCGDELYRKIQESKRAQQGMSMYNTLYNNILFLFLFLERAKANQTREKTNSDVLLKNNISKNNRKLLIPDESTLSRLVAARLDLPISQRLLDQNFKLSIIKRCWEDQLRLKSRLKKDYF